MKKDKTVKIVILLLALTMVVLMLVSGTYAKYTSTASGTDSISVAKWSILLGQTEIATASAQTVTIDLFNTIYDTNGGAAETDVASNLIAPGTKGSFSLDITNNSEVNAEYTLTSSVTNTSNIPVEFSVDGGSTWTTTINTSSSATALNMGATQTIDVKWRWAFEGSGSTNYTASQTDATDTTLGIAGQTSGGAPQLSVTVNVTATQVD